VKYAGLIGLLAAVLTGAALGARVRPASGPSAAACGGSLWGMKTLSDRQRYVVNLAPRSTTIGAILGRQAPARVPTGRSTAFQRQTWEVPASITSYRKEAGGVRMILYDHESYMNAVIPSPSCLPKSARNRQAMLDAWKRFVGCTHPTDSWQPLGAVGSVRGVGFWSGQRSGRGQASNGAELHPVTGFRPVVGCGD